MHTKHLDATGKLLTILKKPHVLLADYLLIMSCLDVRVNAFELFTEVGKWVRFVCFPFFLFSFSVSGKVFPITPLLSGVIVRRVFRAYFW